MVDRSIQKMLLVVALYALSFGSVAANNTSFVWGSDSGDLGTQGHSFNFLTTNAGPQVTVNSFGGSLTFQNGDSLTMDGTLTVSGDVILDASAISAGQTVNITVGASIMALPKTSPNISSRRGYVHVRPYNPVSSVAPQTDSTWGHLAFVTNAGTQINVTCNAYSLAFTGSHNAQAAVHDEDLVVSFWGQGQTKFSMVDGCSVIFRNAQDDNGTNLNPAAIGSYACGQFPAVGANSANDFQAGVKVFVVMDQNTTQRNADACQLVFSRFSYAALSHQTNPKEGQSCEVWLGRYCYLTFLSSNLTGVDLNNNATKGGGYGSIGFDPSSQAASRLVLRILGGSGQDYTDGALVICGHRMPDPSTLVNSVPLGYTAARFPEMNHMAGVEAKMHIMDELAYAASSSYYSTQDSRRGLLVINANATIPWFASNPYSVQRENPDIRIPSSSALEPLIGNAFFFFGSPAVDSQIRNGMVIGVNGHLNVYHNTFLDFVGIMPNALLPLPYNNNTTLATILAQTTKMHNPSALIIDGLTTGLQPDGLTPFADPFFSGNAVEYTQFVNTALHARITMNGDGRVYLRNGGPVGPQGNVRSRANSFLPGAINETFLSGATGSGSSSTVPQLLGYVGDVLAYADASGDCAFSFTIGLGGYENLSDSNAPNYSVPALNCPSSNSNPWLTANSGYTPGCDLADSGFETFGEGSHVLDIEGRLTMCSVVDGAVSTPSVYFARHPGTTTVAAGKLNMPSVRINHAAVETGIVASTGAVVSAIRPLDTTGTTLYPRYQSSVLFFNAPVDYPVFGVPSADFYNVNIIHNDVAKAFVIPDPNVAEPAIVGGSRTMFNDSISLGVDSALVSALFSHYNTLTSLSYLETTFPELPVLRLLNTWIHLQESLVSTGVRFEIPENALDQNGNALYGTSAANTSRIICYNHGDLLDTRRGYGRLFMLGTRQNLASGNMTNGPTIFFQQPYNSEQFEGQLASFYGYRFPLESAFVDVYRRTLTPQGQTPTSTIQLECDALPSTQTALQGANAVLQGAVAQFPSGLSSSQQSVQQAQHLFFMANNSQVATGWTTEFGVKGAHPWWKLDADALGSAPSLPSSSNSSWQFPIAATDGSLSRAELVVGDDFYWFGGIDYNGSVREVENNRNQFNTFYSNGPFATGLGLAGSQTTLFDEFSNGGGLTWLPFGNGVVTPITSPHDSRVIFVDHGGQIRAAANVEVILDTVVARRLSTSLTNYTAGPNDYLSGNIVIPMNQIRFTKHHSIQPYGLDLFDGSVHLNSVGPQDSTLISNANSQEVTIAWRFRTDSPNFLAVKTPGYVKKGMVKQSYRKHAKAVHCKGDCEDVPCSDCKKAKGVERHVHAVRTNIKEDMLQAMQTRSTNALGSEQVRKNFRYPSQIEVASPVSLPTNMVFMTANDYINQLRVSGATIADPFHLYLTGDGVGFARVREIATQDSDRGSDLVRSVYGDGAYAALFMDKGGRVGLGSRDWNDHSINAWSLLGWNYVTLFPNGNSVVDVNSDLLCADKFPIVATTNFGATASHRLEFFSEEPKTIRIQAGQELDLSTFGRGNVPTGQLIAFGGNVRLVFEPGSTLRFPDANIVNGEGGNTTGPVLYMSDASELIFLGNENIDQLRFTDTTGGELSRCKIKGQGQIWLNKSARLLVLDTAMVGIESDTQTPNTDITISIQKQAQMLIGTPTMSGGIFQVGNPNPVTGGSVDFTLRLNGPEALFLIERQGVFALGAGMVNAGNPTANPNGFADTSDNPIVDGQGNIVPDGQGRPQYTPDTQNAWTVQQLYNLNSVDIRVIEGRFDHSRVGDGSTDQSSLMIVGPLTAINNSNHMSVSGKTNRYSMELGSQGNAVIRGGGNVMFIRNQTTPLPVNIWGFADFLVGDSTDNGKYSIMGSSPVIRQRAIVTSNSLGSSTTFTGVSGTFIAPDATHPLPVSIEGVNYNDGRIFNGALASNDDFYKYITFNDYATMTPAKFVAIAATEFDVYAAFVNNGKVTTAAPHGTQYALGQNIQRRLNPTVLDSDSKVADIRQSIAQGFAGGAGVEQDAGPKTFVQLRRSLR